MNYLAKQPDLDAALEHLQTGPLVLIPAFLSHLTYEQNRARTRYLSGAVHLAAHGGVVFTGCWHSRDALVAPSFWQTKTERRAGAVPAILDTWLGLFETGSYFFRPERGTSLVYVTKDAPPQRCNVDGNVITVPNSRNFVIEAAYRYPGFFGAWGLKAGVESGDPRVWDHLL